MDDANALKDKAKAAEEGKEQGEKTAEEIAMEKKQLELKKKKDEAHARYMRYFRAARSTFLSQHFEICSEILKLKILYQK